MKHLIHLSSEQVFSVFRVCGGSTVWFNSLFQWSSLTAVRKHSCVLQNKQFVSMKGAGLAYSWQSWKVAEELHSGHFFCTRKIEKQVLKTFHATFVDLVEWNSIQFLWHDWPLCSGKVNTWSPMSWWDSKRVGTAYVFSGNREN